MIKLKKGGYYRGNGEHKCQDPDTSRSLLTARWIEDCPDLFLFVDLPLNLASVCDHG